MLGTFQYYTFGKETSIHYFDSIHNIQNTNFVHLKDCFLTITKNNFAADFGQIIKILREMNETVEIAQPLSSDSTTSSQNLVHAIRGCRRRPPS